MRVAIVVSGSRGDVQPMLALAVGLRAAGHEALVCSSPDNAAWAGSLGCAFEAIGEPLRANVALTGWGPRDFDPFIRRQIAAQVHDLPRLVDGYDIVVASGLTFGAHAVAESAGIGYRYVSLVPASFLGMSRDPLGTRLVRGIAARYADLRYGSALDRGRQALGLPRAGGVMRQLMGSLTIAATDPALTVLPQGARLLTTQTGYPILAGGKQLSDELRSFLDAGPPPLYAGFGSMPVGNRERISSLLLDAGRRAGQRLIVSRGWAEIPETTHDGSCLFIGDEPHDELFPRVSAVVHHGGAGTVATAARAGVPQIILPAAADQFLWRRTVVRLGLGPGAPMLRRASAASLRTAITTGLSDPDYRRRAAEIAARLAEAPDGVTTTVAEVTGRSARAGP
jgi:vancomycin aglycone glucosyltransferase